MYHKIRVTFLDVLDWLTRVNHAFVATLRIPDPEWDVYLTRSNDYKRQLDSFGLSAHQREDILFGHHPRFVWRALLTSGGRAVVEILFDATDMARSFPVYRVLWRDAGVWGTVQNILTVPQALAALRAVLSLQLVEMIQRAPGP